MKTILLTGGSGFIGRHIKENLKGEYEILSPGSRELDLLDQGAVDSFFAAHTIDVIVHTAKLDDVKRPVTDYEVLDANLRMFYNLLAHAGDVERMFYLGSGAEYDRSVMKAFATETDLGESIPKDAYGFSKYVMARAAEQSKNVYELCLFGVYGAYEAYERRFISNAVYRSLKGEPITLERHVYFDYLYVKDFADILKRFVDAQTLRYHRYNVCTGEHADLYDLAKLVKEKTNNPYEIMLKEDAWKREYSGDNRRLLEEFSDISFTSYAKGVEALIPYIADVLTNRE